MRYTFDDARISTPRRTRNMDMRYKDTKVTHVQNLTRHVQK